MFPSHYVNVWTAQRSISSTYLQQVYGLTSQTARQCHTLRNILRIKICSCHAAGCTILVRCIANFIATPFFQAVKNVTGFRFLILEVCVEFSFASEDELIKQFYDPNAAMLEEMKTEREPVIGTARTLEDTSDNKLYFASRIEFRPHERGAQARNEGMAESMVD